MTPRRKLFLFPVLGLVGALLWTSLGTLSTASGQSPTGFIGRAHKGESAPSFQEPVFILVLGGDARRGNSLNQRMDSIHIVAIAPPDAANPTGPVRGSIIGIPRDTYVDIPGRAKNKINAVGTMGGPELMIRVVEGLTGCDLDYWMLSGFDGFRGEVRKVGSQFVKQAPGVIDDIGGIDFRARYPLHDDAANAEFDVGTYHFDGSNALQWARSRKASSRPRGDFDRSVGHGELMIATVAEMRKDYLEQPGTALRNLAAARKHLRMDIPVLESLTLGLFAMKIKPSSIKNVVMDGGTATVNGSSIVTVGSGANDQFVDICSDGVLGG